MKRLSLAAFALSVIVGGIAQAHDHRAPRATLLVADEKQAGRLHHADGWARPDEDPRFCVVEFATGFPTFRKPLRYSLGEEVVVRLHKAAPPLEVEVQKWPGVDDKGHASGTPTPLPWALRPVVDGTVRAWEVVISPPVAQQHMYLGVGAYWADEDGCSQPPDLGSQYAAWTFHLVNR